MNVTNIKSRIAKLEQVSEELYAFAYIVSANYKTHDEYLAAIEKAKKTHRTVWCVEVAPEDECI